MLEEEQGDPGVGRRKGEGKNLSGPTEAPCLIPLWLQLGSNHLGEAR